MGNHSEYIGLGDFCGRFGKIQNIKLINNKMIRFLVLFVTVH